MNTLPTLATVPAHAFEPAKRANPGGGLALIDDPMCGYHHRIGDDMGVFCAESADHPVHNGAGQRVRVRDWTDDEIEAMNR